MKTEVLLTMLVLIFGICAVVLAQDAGELPADLPEEAIEELEKAKDLMGEGGPEVGQVAPDFTLQALEGGDFTLSSLKDTVPVVLIFGSCT